MPDPTNQPLDGRGASQITDHTPGPWQAEAHRVFVAGSIEQICNCYCGNAFANARLIAAAPTMLTALRLAANALAVVDVAPKDARSAERTLHAVLAAIAAAEGR